MSLSGIILGFILAVIWDLYKNFWNSRRELKKAIRAIIHEQEINIRLLKDDIYLLDEDSKAADRDEEVIKSVDLLMTTASDSAYLKGVIELKSIDLYIQLKEVCVIASLINFHIQGRQLYCYTNGSMNNYSRRRKIINEQLKKQLSEQKGRLENFLNTINK